MPWHIQKRENRYCVVKGHSDNPGETLKCYDSKANAKKYLKALYWAAGGEAQGKDADWTEMDNEMPEYISDLPTTKPDHPNAGDVLESRIHQAFTVVADMLYGYGYMTRDERIELSGAIGDGLDTVSQAIDKLELRKRMLAPEVATMAVGIFKGTNLPVSVISSYKDLENNQDRWVAVSTAALWDREGEMVTTEAMDWDIQRTKDTGEWPELRMWHIRGLKLGMCDAMSRIGKWAVDQGYWYDTPFAQAMKDLVVVNKGKWKISRGFFPVRAAGTCPMCDTRLSVGPTNILIGIRCHNCGDWYPKARLKQLKYERTRTYDLSVTDVPVLDSTSIAAWSTV